MNIKNLDPIVGVVLVNHNGKQLLKECLPVILNSDYSHFKVVVVDCASEDNSAEFVEQNFPDVFLIKCKKDPGLAAGNNLGIKYAAEISASYVICVNNDTEVDKRWIKEAVKAAETDPLLGIVGFAEYGKMTRTKTTYKDFLEARDRFSVGKVTYVSDGPGTLPFFMVRMSVFMELGLFDEKYFAYGDDNDFELRVIRAGYKLAYINVPCFHQGMRSFKPFSLRAARLVMRNTLRLNLVHSSPSRVFIVMRSVFNYACNPFLKYDPSDLEFRRFRPSNIFINFRLFIYALWWNLINFPEVMMTRRQTTRVVNLVNERIKRGSLK